MGGNPRYRLWTRDNWQGYAPTIKVMVQREWSLTIHCSTCRLGMVLDAQRVLRERGPQWSPWGKSAPCRRIGCVGRMWLRAYAPRPNQFIDL